MKNIKGSIQDIFFVIIILFVTAILFLFILYISNIFNNYLTPFFNKIYNNSGDITIKKVDTILNKSVDYIFLVIFVAYFISLIIVSFLMQTHPVFLPIFIILLIVGIFIPVILSNIYELIIQNNVELSLISTKMPITNFILQKFPLIYAIGGILLLVILFAKTRQGGNLINVE